MRTLLPVVIATISVFSPGAPQGETGGRQDNRIVEGTAYARPTATSKPALLRDTIEVQQYTVKVFHKGTQVRETRFTIDADGKLP